MGSTPFSLLDGHVLLVLEVWSVSNSLVAFLSHLFGFFIPVFVSHRQDIMLLFIETL